MANYFGIQWPDPPDDEQRPYTPVPIQQQQRQQAKAPAGVQGRFQPPVTPTVPTPPVYQQDRWESAPREVYPQDRWEAAPQAQPPMRDRWESAPTPPQRPYLPLVTQDGPRSEAMPPLVAAAPPVGGLPIVQAATRILPKLWEQRDEWAEAAKEIVQDYPARVREYWQSGQAVEDARQSPVRFVKEQGQRALAELLRQAPIDLAKLPGPEDARPQTFLGELQEANRQGEIAPLNLPFYLAMRAYETTGEGPAAVESNAREQAKRETNFYDIMARANEVQTRLRDNITRMSPEEIARDREYIVQLHNAANTQVLRREQELLYERGQQQGILPALRATEAEKRQYRTNAPMGEQFLAGFFLDPLNAFDALGPARDAYRVSRAAKELAPAYPTVKTAGGVLRPATSAEAKAATVTKLSKYNAVNQRLGPLAAFIPWRHTPQTMGEQLVNRTINATNRMLDGLPKTADGGIDLNLLQKAVADPHAPDIVAATAGYSQSAEWLDTTVVIDRALGVTPEATDAVATAQRAKIQQVEEQVAATQKAIAETTAQIEDFRTQGKSAQQINRATNRLTKQQNSLANQQKHLDNLKAQVQQPGRVDFAGLIKLAQQPDSDSLTIAAELARQYADAAESFFPTTGKGLGRKLVNARDRFNNSILSTALLGTNPGYAFRNAANNLVTALVDGVNPYQSAEDLRALWVRWGAPPVQTKQGIGPGDAFKNRATTAEYLQTLATPLRMRDTFNPNGRKWRDYTRAVAANWEAYASERIVAHHIQTYFPQTWGGYLKELRKQIVQAGQLDETQAQQITRLWASKLNRTELHEAIDAMTGPSRPRVTPPTAPTTPPTAPSAPGWGTRPGAKKPYGAEPAPAPVLDLARTLSEDEAAQLVAEAGPGADTLARELLQAGPAAQRVFVDVLVPAQERSAQLAAHVNTLAGQTYTPGQRASLQQFLEDVQGVIETAKDNDDAMRQGVFEAAQNVTEAERTLIFREWRRARDTARRELYRRLDALEEARMPELGFDEQAITNSRTHRQFIADAWARSDRVIENYWTGKGKGISQDYEAVNKERRRIWTDVQNRIKLRAEQWDADLDRAVAKGKGSAVTAAPEPPAPDGMPMFISKARRQELYDLGYNKADVDAMTPAEGQAIAQAQRTKPAPVTAAPVGAEPPAPAPTAAQPVTAAPDAGQISRISAKARELGIPSASDRNVGTGAQGAMWDQHALNIARQRFPGEIRPDSKAFRSLQKATPDELNLVEQALDERLAERAAPRVDVPPAAGPEVAPAPIPPTAPDPRKPWETPSIRIERARRGTRLPVPGQPSTRVPFGKEPSAPAVGPTSPSQMTWPEYQRYRISLLTPEQQAKWAQRDVNGIAFAARENVLQQWGDDWTRLTQTTGPSRAAYAPPAVTREAEFMGPYAPPAIVGDYEARALPPSVFETWDDLVLDYDRAPWQSPAMTERPLQPHDWQRYGVPERMSIAPTPPQVTSTPPSVAAPSVAAPGKQPWEMTRAEFVAQQRAEFTPRKGGRYDKGDVWDNFHESQAKELHNLKVVDALRRGKSVPPQVLAEYPELQRASGAGGMGAAPASRFAGKSREELENFRQMYLDNIENLRQSRKPIPETYRTGLAEIEQLLAGETVQTGKLAGLQVFGHPQATTIGGGKYSNLIPINIERGNVASIDRRISDAQKLLDELQTKIGRAEVEARTPAKTGAAKRAQNKAKEYLNSAQFDEDTTVRDLLREETLPELQRLRKLVAEQTPAGGAAPSPAAAPSVTPPTGAGAAAGPSPVSAVDEAVPVAETAPAVIAPTKSSVVFEETGDVSAYTKGKPTQTGLTKAQNDWLAKKIEEHAYATQGEWPQPVTFRIPGARTQYTFKDLGQANQMYYTITGEQFPGFGGPLSPKVGKLTGYSGKIPQHGTLYDTYSNVVGAGRSEYQKAYQDALLVYGETAPDQMQRILDTVLAGDNTLMPTNISVDELTKIVDNLQQAKANNTLTQKVAEARKARGGRSPFALGITAPGTQEAFAVMDAATAAARRVADFFTNRRAAAQPVKPLTPEQAAWLHQFADDFAAPQQMKAKAIASNIAVKMRNFALGDYADRRNIHEWLTWLYPYAYWYTFTYPNWARRIMQHPAILSNYARYKQVVREQNREYYRDMVGDPNAEPPDYWQYQLMLPFKDTRLYFNLERNLNPLVQLVESFKQTAKSAAPAFPWNAQTPEGERGFFQSGDFIQALGDFGPSISPPLIYAYALWLASQGYTEAAQQWVGGYLTPMSRLMRPVTAAIREKIPATGAVIPPGGWSPEMLILDFMKRGGDYWQQRSGIPAALVDLYRTNKATATEVENAAWSRDVWDSKWGDAAQANALKTLAPVFASWLLGQGFKPTDITDVQIQQMWDDKAALTAQKGTLSKEDYNAAWEAFKEKYPWFNVFMLARSQDPIERLDAFTDLVLDRLPPAGPQRQQMLTAAGMPPELMDRYYSDKYSTANFTPEERAQFELAIEKLAGTVDVPDAATQATYSAAGSERRDINAAAAAAIGMTLAAIQAIEGQYYDIKKTQGEDAAKAYLAQHPELKKFWNERTMLGLQGSTAYQQFYTDANDPYDKGRKEAITKFGEARVREADAYVALTDEQALAFARANPEAHARIKEVLNVLYKYTQNRSAGAGSAGAQRAALYDKGRAEAVQQYGEAGVREAEAYNDLDDAQSAAFRQQNPEAYNRIKEVNRAIFKYLPSNYSSSYTPRTYSGGSSYSGGRSYSSGGRSYGSAPAAPVAPVTVTPQQPAPAEWEAWQESDFNARWQPLVDADPALPQLVNVLFGKDMLNVLRLWLKLTPEQRALWLQANPQLWAMLQRFMRWFMAQQVGKTGAGVLLGSIPPNAPIPSATTVPPNAPYVPLPPAVPSAPAVANAGIPLPP